MTVFKGIDASLESLLELNGERFLLDNGYWTKIEARIVDPSDEVPHGIKYSLTLHDKNNTRILGYDNAHGIKPKKKKYKVNIVEWDHKHEKNKIKPYEFENVG